MTFLLANSIPPEAGGQASPVLGVLLVALLLAYLAFTIFLEWLSTLWVRRRLWFGAVVLVNVLTYPVFFVLVCCMELDRFGIALAELAVALVEGTLLCLPYGFGSWRRMYGAAFVMNAASAGVSLLLLLLLQWV